VGLLEASPADEAAGEGDEGVVEVGAAFPSDGAVVMTLSGVPRPSPISWCLLPVLRRSTGVGPVSAPPFRPDVGAVHAGPRPVEFARRVQFGRQNPVQLVKDAGLLPPLQAAPAGLPGAEPQLQGQRLPGQSS
jgi:hypothetical protein